MPSSALDEIKLSLDLACCIVDVVMQLRKQSFEDMGIKDKDVTPDYRLLVTKRWETEQSNWEGNWNSSFGAHWMHWRQGH